MFNSISTGLISLDKAIGIGGIPRGRIIELYGPESSGKTTLALSIIAKAQKRDNYAAFIDAENAMDLEYAKKLGVCTTDLIISQPVTGEEALELVEIFVRSNAFDIIVIDSVAALVPKAELEGELKVGYIGLHSRLMSQSLRRLSNIISRSKTSVIFINQVRNRISSIFGNKKVTSGGKALGFYSSLRLDICSIAKIKEADRTIGHRTVIKITKNKMGYPFESTEFDIMYNEGVSFIGDIVDTAIKSNIITKSGTWFYFNNANLGQGRNNVKIYLQENKELCNKIEKEIKTFYIE
ncbi:recombinase RecA [archaeon]|nr:recombinase RecA [archaeon]